MSVRALSPHRSKDKPKRASSRPNPVRLLLRNQLASFAVVLLVVIALVALLTPVLPIQNPDATALADRLLPPLTAGHLLGTDELGRDILARLLWGLRISIAIGLSATLAAALVGSTIGIVAGYFGGRIDNIFMRAIDMLMAFPYILLALAIVAALGPGLMNALYAIAIVNIPFFARNIRGVTLGLAHREFIDAARLSGKGHLQILSSELLPNVLPVIVITMSTTVGWMILETAGLSFLGLGAQPPQADLGSMLGDGRKIIFTAPHVAVIPGLMIFVLVMCINLVGDGIRDVLDPRLKSGALARPAAMTTIERATKAPHPDKMAAKQIDPAHALEVDDLHTIFALGNEEYKAVGGVSFTLGAQECLGIIGESGSGKSVTALSLAGLVSSPPGKIVSGEVWFQDQDILSLPLSKMQRIRGEDLTYVFQDPLSTLHPLYSAGEQIVEAIRTHHAISYRQAWDKAVELLRLVRIPNPERRAHSYPHELSGGMRQRVGIAIALANSPHVIIADEPTTALDVTVQAQILKLLKDLQDERSSSLLFITHDFGVVSEICDRIAVMYAGKIVEMGRTDDILARPAHPYTRRLIDCVPKLGASKRKLEAIPGLPPALNDLPEGCAFADRCDFVEAACRQGKIKLERVGEAHTARCIKPLEYTS